MPSLTRAQLLALQLCCLPGLVMAQKPAAQKPAAENPTGYDLKGGIEDLDVGDSSADQPNLDAAELVGATGDDDSRIEATPVARWKASPHFDFKITYDDNIFIQAFDRKADVIFAISPGITLGLWNFEKRLISYLDQERPAAELEHSEGNYLLLDYTPTILRFVNNTAENTINHNAIFDIQWQFSKLTLGANLQYLKDTSPNIEIGNRLKETKYLAGVRGSYQISDKTSFDSSFQYIDSQYVNYLDSVEWNTAHFLHYELTPLIRTGIGVVLGRIDVVDTPPQTYQQLVGDFSYDLTGKLTLRAFAGVDFRQFHSAVGDRITPVFGVGVTYTPAEATSIMLDAYRLVKSSGLLAGEDYTVTGVRVIAKREVFAGGYVQLEAGYHRSNYAAITAGATPSRRDNYFYFKPGLLYNLNTWCNLGLFYQYQKNNSTLSGSQFLDNQITFEVSFVY